MSKTSKPTGGVIADEKGNRSWKWAGEDEMDTARVRALGEELSLEAPSPTEGQLTLDPYNRNPPAAQPAKRRTLDDMRRLSEEIKKRKTWKRED